MLTAATGCRSGSLDRLLSRDDLASLEALAAISGDRYGAEQMRHLDSARR